MNPSERDIAFTPIQTSQVLAFTLTESGSESEKDERINGKHQRNFRVRVRSI